MVAGILAEVHRSADAADEFLVDSLPVPVCANIRIRRCRLYQGKAYHGYIASKQVYFYGLRIHLVCTASGRPVEIALALGGVADIGMFRTLVRELPAGSRLIGDKGYISAEEAAVCWETEAVELVSLRRENMKGQHPPWWAWYLGYRRRRIKTGFSVLCPLLPRSIHETRSVRYTFSVQMGGTHTCEA